MATRNHRFAPGEFYHVFNRGTEKRMIYQTTSDYQRFVNLLYLANTSTPINVRDIVRDYRTVWDYEISDRLVSVGAYCLMPNHFHILLTPLTEDGVGVFMNKLCTSYTMYFNKKSERTGSLFQGTYKSTHADSNNYLKYLYAYIHLNPLKVCQRAGEDPLTALRRYQYSSLPDYLGQSRPEGIILTPEAFPEYFQTSADHLGELKSWLLHEDEFTEGYPR
ncbi:MAG: transposase [Patescibacteria group bacterium]